MSGLVFRERDTSQQSDSHFTPSLYRGEQQENSSGYPPGQETNFGTRETPLQESSSINFTLFLPPKKLLLTQVYSAAGRHHRQPCYQDTWSDFTQKNKVRNLTSN